MKLVQILRGTAGSGKSTFASHCSNAVICSADHYFSKTGEYKFDHTKLSQAHGECFKNFVEALQAEKPWVIVDNTNTTAVEIAPYVLACQAFGYDYEILLFNCDPKVAAERNVHGVPLSSVQRMADRMKEKLPPHWNKVKYVSGNPATGLKED